MVLPNIDTTNPNYWLIISNDGYSSKEGDLFRIEKRCIPQNKPSIQYIDLVSIPDANNSFQPTPNTQSVTVKYSNGDYDTFTHTHVQVDGQDMADADALFSALINALI